MHIAENTGPQPTFSTFLIFSQILINLTYLSSKFSHFLPHFDPPDGQLAHPGRPWLRHCCTPSPMTKPILLLIESTKHQMRFSQCLTHLLTVHYNLQGLLLCKSAPIEEIQSGATFSEAQSCIHISGYCCSPNIPISGVTLWSDPHPF